MIPDNEPSAEALAFDVAKQHCDKTFTIRPAGYTNFLRGLASMMVQFADARYRRGYEWAREDAAQVIRYAQELADPKPENRRAYEMLIEQICALTPPEEGS